MNAHTRYALPMNTPGNLKHLHDKAQAESNNSNDAVQKDTVTQARSAGVQVRRDSTRSKFARKMSGLFAGKKTETALTEEEAAELKERKRATMAKLVGSHAFVQMGRR
ncbi:hypothetical protein PHYBOEH_000408 [Phytophthora boehmeriae]|uniref:Uncharacterized protein n=1 Tax=Phytophthora boehmeriae TaxID=109152 RepID=A0A8T1X100_9STRA|nr:hypothetical protein PHYBOEH_000408 [Phytophthora boehmeriae]